MPRNTTLIAPFTIPAEVSVKGFSARSFVDAKNNFFRLKRMLDLVISSAFILFVLSWLIPLMAILIHADSKGPLFFKQKRVGRGGRSFWCLKFRTMYVNRDSNTRQADRYDRRITRIGRFLRTTNIDEFPQFINVFRGEMSVIGPRPHMYADCNRFSQVVNGYKFRNLVKPGITGLAQVKGYHGPAITYESIFRRFQWDAFYVRNASLRLDLRILRHTIMQRL
jgi:putative colanic acid biosysnthesis UDP-glucose lipid carrier transferase